MLDIKWNDSFPLFDTHGHLDLDDFNDDRISVYEKYSANEKNLFINIGFNFQTSLNTVFLTKQFERIYGSAGLHPHEASEFKSSWLSTLENFLQQEKMIAIGEIGLDFYRNLSPKTDQERSFIEQLEFARQKKLPVIIHCRDAGKEMSSLLKKYPHWGILHCFQGDLNLLETGLSMDYFISFAGNITYKNNKLNELIKEISEEKILVETDCPFLTPNPFRGKRNEPYAVSLVVRKIAEIIEKELEYTAELLYENGVSFINKALSFK